MTLNDNVTIALNRLIIEMPAYDPLVRILADHLVVLMGVGLIATVGISVWRQMGCGRNGRKLLDRALASIFLLVPGTWSINTIFKYIFHTARPFIEHPSLIQPLMTDVTPYAMPSGHSALAMAIAITTYAWSPLLGRVYLWAALLVGLSRVVAGVHYFGDVLVGWSVGILGAYVLGRLIGLYYQKP